MYAVTVDEPGPPEVLVWRQVDDPAPPDDDEVLIDVVASAVNRADLLQRQGFYPPPPGASEVIGMECSGRVAAVGRHVSDWQVGDEVCALLAGGGYASKVVVPAGQVMPVPDGVDLLEAAALPEVACTVWSNLFEVADLTDGEKVLIHGGAGGIGTMAIQLVRALRPAAQIFVTAGSQEKLDRTRELGADVAINYRDEDFVERVRDETSAQGVDVILDNMGAKYLARNLDALAKDGRLVIIGLQGGVKAEANLGLMLSKRLTVAATTLRARPVEQKSAICRAVVDNVWPAIASGQVRPIVDRVLPMPDAGQAHQALEESSHTGKVLLAVP